MAIFSIFPIFGQIEYNMVSIFSKLYRFYSILVETHHFLKQTFAKLFLEGGRGDFFIFVTITLGGGGVSSNLINVINFTVFFTEVFPNYELQVIFKSECYKLFSYLRNFSKLIKDFKASYFFCRGEKRLSADAIVFILSFFLNFLF